MVEELLRISAFADVTGLSRRTLLFYDQMDLLKPAWVDDENGYRYYSRAQIDVARFIAYLREIQMPLKDIQGYLARRSPEEFMHILREQAEDTEARILRLMQMADALKQRLRQTGEAKQEDRWGIRVETLPAAPLFVSDPIIADCCDHESFAALLAFYEQNIKSGLVLGAVGGVVHMDLLTKGCWGAPFQYFYEPVDPSLYPCNQNRPAGKYIIGRDKAPYGSNGSLFVQILDHMQQNGLRPSGHGYERYLLDEHATGDPAENILEISIGIADFAAPEQEETT